MGFVVSYCGECGQRISGGSSDDTRLRTHNDRFLCVPCHRRVSTTRLRVRRVLAKPGGAGAGAGALLAICQKLVHRGKRSGALAGSGG